jgi:hypothetical protein
VTTSNKIALEAFQAKQEGQTPNKPARTAGGGRTDRCCLLAAGSWLAAGCLWRGSTSSYRQAGLGQVSSRP